MLELGWGVDSPSPPLQSGRTTGALCSYVPGETKEVILLFELYGWDNIKTSISVKTFRQKIIKNLTKYVEVIRDAD